MAAGGATFDRRSEGSRREAILDAALRLFAEHGVRAVTTRQIASEVGISQPSLYAHFANRDALAAEVCVRAFEELAARMGATLQGGSEGWRRVREMAHVYVDFGLTRPEAYRIAFMAEPGTHALGPHDAKVLAAGLTAFQIHRTAVGEALGVGVGAEEADLLAQSLWAALHGLVSLLIARPEFPWVDRNRLIETHIERLAAGL